MIVKKDSYVVEWKTPDATSANNWSANMFSNTGGSFTGTPDVNTTYYLQITSEVSLDANEGTASSKTSVTSNVGKDMPALQGAELPTRTNYIFEGYYDDPTGGTKYYNADGSSAKNWDKRIAKATLYAHWKSKTKLKKVAETFQTLPGNEGKKIVVNINAEQALATDKQVEKIQEKVGSKKIVAYDVDLVVTADGDEIKNAGDINTTLITLSYKFDFAKKQDFQTYRLHTDKDGKESINELTETANAEGEYVVYNKEAGTISVTAKKYSTYAFAYNEVVDESPSASLTSSTTPSKAAGTGDTTGIIIAAIAVLALAAGTALRFAKKRCHQ